MKKARCILVAMLVVFTMVSGSFFSEAQARESGTLPNSLQSLSAHTSDASSECQHDWSDWSIEVEPTCGSTGTEQRFCNNCFEVEQKTIKATGKHEWDFWETVKSPTVFRKGKKQRECMYCDAIQIGAIAKKKPFAKFSKKKYKIKAGKKLKLKLKFAKGDKEKKWKSGNKAIATVNSKGKVTAKKSGTVTITAFLKSGKKAKCSVKVSAPKKKASSGGRKKSGSSKSGTVYWTPNGSVYHYSANCPTLSRSRAVYSGSIASSRKSRACKVCS